MTQLHQYQDAFDAEFYAKQLKVKIKPERLLSHFFSTGEKDMLDPSPFFSCSAYLKDYPDVKKSGINPFEHFVKFGANECRTIIPSERADARGFETSSTTEFYRKAKFGNPSDITTVKLIKKYIDSNYYFARYDDLDRNHIDAALHYVISGWHEGRDPSASFDARFYADSCVGSNGSQLNPLLHYVMFGKKEGLPTFGTAGSGRHIRKEVGSKLEVNPAIRAALEARRVAGRRARQIRNPSSLNIGWVVPDFDKGGGGHMTIFRMIRWLEIFGHTCTIWVDRDIFQRTMDERNEILQRDYQCVRARVKMVDDEFFATPHEILFATSWETAYTVRAAASVAKFYFIQDMEPLFHPAGATALVAEASYKFDMPAICASPWLAKIMREKHSAPSYSFFLAADPVYRQKGSRPRNPIARIAAYSRDHTERRAVSILKLALEELSVRGVEFEVDFFGSSIPVTKAPFAGRDWGIVDAEHLNDIYNACDIGVCFSTTNYSLVPQEMMQAGLPVVELSVESTREVFPDGVVTLAEPSASAIADAIEGLIKDEKRRAIQSEAAKDWVSNFSWEKSARDVEKAVVDVLTSTRKMPDPSSIPVKHEAGHVKASVVIPTLNGGDVLKNVIDAVLRQRTPWNFEFIIVDSGSTDGTLDYIKSKPIKLIQIAKKDFQHGRTRNLAAKAAVGEFVCFLTHDALPVDEFWLYNLVTSVERDEEIAGAFGRHVAWPSASAFTKRDIAGHFKGFLQLPLVASKFIKKDFVDQGWLSYLIYYSDNNSCLRRSIWEKHPYPEVDYGEDQLWAFNIIRAGYKKAYAPSAAVYHSHDYDEDDTFARARTEANFFKQHLEFEMSPQEPDKLIRKLNVDDLVWGVRNNVPMEEIQQRQRLNACRIAGFVAGGMPGLRFKSAF
jgi:glycosyltransferase involved in cell wall biosynthesis